MKSISFKEATNKIAEHQKEFNTLISQWNPDEQSVNVCFALEKEEIEEINRTQMIWFKQVIGRNLMQPILISPFKDHVISSRKEINSLDDIDTTTPEGKMLFASLAMLTTESRKNQTPEETMDDVKELCKKIDHHKNQQS